MNREIKFRAFHKETNKMYEVFSFCDEFVKIVVGIGSAMKLPKSDFMPLMQFTGLKDRNGVDICEGDIVNSGKGEILWCTLQAMFKVKWHGKVFKRIRGQNDRYTLNGEPLFMNSHIAWQVIGNIHENPELLNND